MGYDPVGTAPSGKCQDGTRRLFDYVQSKFQTGSFGCYNPDSRVPSGGMSLHAEGRAFDAALNAYDATEMGRGDTLLHWAVDNFQRVGLQEILWRGFIWSFQRQGDGIRSGVQQAAHMNHVHFGVDWDAAKNWQVNWVEDSGFIDAIKAAVALEVAEGPLLKRGSRGREVEYLQHALNLTIKSGLNTGGFFGARTEKAVKDFQALVVYLGAPLKTPPSGVVGAKVRQALVKALS